LRPRHPILRGIVNLAALAFFLILGLGLLGRLSADGVGPFEKNAVAVVTVEGVIENSNDIVQTLERLAKNDGVKAVVLRVDSPGGGVAPSQEIYDAVWRVREKKTIVASLGGEAASGGYYIASPCQMIVANPGTLTGSIGVIMHMGTVSELMKKIGVSPITIKAGKFKDIGSPFREMTDEERKLLGDVLDNVHEQFIAAVARGRNLKVDQIRPLADGRLFSGQQAQDLHLVDRLGGLEDAVKLAAEKAGITGEPHSIEIEKAQPPWWWKLVSGLAPSPPAGLSGLQFLYSGPPVSG
jgi:protease IV